MGVKVTTTNGVMNGAKKMMIPRILDILSNPSSTTILLLTSPHNAGKSAAARSAGRWIRLFGCGLPLGTYPLNIYG